MVQAFMWRRVWKFLLAVLVLVLATGAAVYAGTRIEDDSKNTSETVRPDGSLTSQPDPLSLADVAQERKGTPAEAVMKLWFWAQWGSSPNIIASYHPAVVRRLGSADIAGAYAMKRASMLQTRPRFVDVSKAASGDVVVTLEGLQVNTPPQPYSFTLRRVAGQWMVIFDTLLEDGLAAYVQFRLVPDPDAKRPPAAAQRGGLETARAYRVAFLCRGAQADQVPAATPPIEANPDC